MIKKIVVFTAGYLGYIKGDKAGFAPEKANELVHVKKVAAFYEPPQEGDQAATLKIDSSEAVVAAEKVVEDARAELEARGAGLDTREADLNAKAADLDAREKALLEREEAAEKAAAPAAKKGAAKKSETSEPPAQGSK